MSNFLAIATVTAGLAQLLQARVAGDVPGATVTNVRPEGGGAGLPVTGVNLYLYQVTPNPFRRNADLPNRDDRGALRQRPRLALDLHYLLTFYGDEAQLVPQRVLGSVARTLNDQPLLTRRWIEDAQNAVPSLAASNLADEAEPVRFTPTALSLEELSKLWSVFFQIPYTLSMCYQACLVMLESDEAPLAALPVQARVVRVMPFRQPVVESVTSAAGPLAPILPGTELVIRGRELQGDQTFLRVAGVRVAPAFVSPTEIRVALAEPPFPAGELRAGVQGAQVAHEMIFGLPDDPAMLSPADPHAGLESKVEAFVLHPVITGPPQAQNTQNDLNNTRRGEIRVDVAPSVGQMQRVVLVLNGTGAAAGAAYTFPGPPRVADTPTLIVPFARVRPGAYFVRVQVDGAESLLDQDPDPANPTFTGPQVNIA